MLMTQTPVTPTKSELLYGFFRIGISGFGGVLPHARRMMVDDRHWISDREFTELLGLGQPLPGPNIVNVSIIFGARHHGWQGALCAFVGLMSAPLVIVLTLATIYDHFADSVLLTHALAGVAAAAAGLVLATSAKLAVQMDRNAWSVAIMLAAFIAVMLHVPLLIVLLVLLPISLAFSWHSSRHTKTQSQDLS